MRRQLILMKKPCAMIKIFPDCNLCMKCINKTCLFGLNIRALCLSAFCLINIFIFLTRRPSTPRGPIQLLKVTKSLHLFDSLCQVRRQAAEYQPSSSRPGSLLFSFICQTMSSQCDENIGQLEFCQEDGMQ